MLGRQSHRHEQNTSGARNSPSAVTQALLLPLEGVEEEEDWSRERSMTTARASHGLRPSRLNPRCVGNKGGSVTGKKPLLSIKELECTHLQLLEDDAGNDVVEKRTAAATTPRRFDLADLKRP
jgi:hypothetical protein